MDYYCLMVCYNTHTGTHTHECPTLTLLWSYTLNKLLKGVVESITTTFTTKRNERASFLTFSSTTVSYSHTEDTFFSVVRPEFRGMNIFIIIISSRTLLFHVCACVCAVMHVGIKVHFFLVFSSVVLFMLSCWIIIMMMWWNWVNYFDGLLSVALFLD